jgi:two-component system sensor histidine kinase KdpD
MADVHDESRAESFLRLIRRAEWGKLKIYLGYAAGVGKTYQMLMEAHRLKKDGIDVLAGIVETHGRIETEALLKGLDIIPRRKFSYKGIEIDEMDIDAILARRPAVVLVDELAHTNAPGSRNRKRYQDVEEILAAGIHVISTLNIQHLESLYDTVERGVRIKVKERVPDKVLAEADQIVNVDLSAEDLRKRLSEGKVYTPERIEVAMEGFFKETNLGQLRELTLREIASYIESRRRGPLEEELPSTPDQIMVCLSSKGENSDMLLRYASRLAGKLNRTWYAVYVQTPAENPLLIEPKTQRLLGDTLTLAKQLGAIVFTFKGEDVTKTILQFAKEYRVGHIVVGTPRNISMFRKLMGEASLVDRLIKEGEGFNVVVLDTRHPERRPIERRTEAKPGVIALSRLIPKNRIFIWRDPLSKEAAIGQLIKACSYDMPFISEEKLSTTVFEREAQGSTFFTEGIALPHARISGLQDSIAAMGIAPQGVTDREAGVTVEAVFLILSPGHVPDEQVKILGTISRFTKDSFIYPNVLKATSPKEASYLLQEWDSFASGPAKGSSE